MSHLWRRISGSFWAVPLIYAAAAACLGIVLSAMDEALNTSFSLPFLFAGGPEGARSLLSAIITSMISFTGLVFSITIVVLQLTSSQFSPRVLRTFLEDRFNQSTLGVFVATFVYALVVLRGVRGTAGINPFVPQLAVTFAFILVLLSVVVFLSYIHHIAQSIRVATIITHIWSDSRHLLEHRHPRDAEADANPVPPEGPVHRVMAATAGVVQRINDDELQQLAVNHSLAVFVLRSVGEYVPEGAPLLDVYGSQVPDVGKFHAAFSIGKERSMEEDLGFGFRQLVDIAERALSTGVNDPTTAIQVVDQLHDLLRRLVTRPLLARQRLTAEGRICVKVPQPTFAQYLGLAVDEISYWGKGDERIQRRLGVMLEDLYHVARPENRATLSHALARLGHNATAGAGLHPTPSDVGLR